MFNQTPVPTTGQKKVDWALYAVIGCVVLLMACLVLGLLAGGGIYYFTRPAEVTQVTAMSAAPATSLLVGPGPGPQTYTSRDMEGGINVTYTLIKGFWHFNVACGPVCGEGVEENYVVEYVLDIPTAVTLPEGHAWWYSPNYPLERLGPITVRDSLNDYWPSTLPSFVNVSGIRLLRPTFGFIEVPVVQVIELKAVPATPTMAPVVVPPTAVVPPVAKETDKFQGEDKVVTVKSGMYYYASFWWRDDNHEYHYVFEPTQAVDVKFNGTLIEYSAKPRRVNVTDSDNKHIWPDDLSKLPELQGKVTLFPLESLK